MGKIYLGDEILAYDVDAAIDSGSTNPVTNSAITEALDNKLDKVNFLNQIWPKDSVYITYDYKNPSQIVGGQWELIGGEDADKNYYPAFAINTDTAGTTINESLPNISGSVSSNRFGNGRVTATGVFSSSTELTSSTGSSYDGGVQSNDIKFNASDSSSVYQDGAQVNVNAIKLFFWKRTDDAPIEMSLKPVTLEIQKDVLWSGDTGTGTISLSGSIDDYDQIEISVLADNTYKLVYLFERDKLVNNTLIPVSWESSNRHVHFTNVASTSLTFGVGNCRVTMVRGIKDAYVSRTDITTEINSGSTDDKAASAKAVYDALNEIEFIEKYVTVNGGGEGSYSGTITCNPDEVPLGRGATTIQVNGAVGWGWVDRITKNSDTSYTFSGWRNANGGSSITILAVFVKMPMKKR